MNICGMTICMWHDSFIYVTRLIYISDIHLCAMTHSHMWHDSFIYVTCTSHSYTWRKSFTYVTWLIYTCDKTHSHTWHDSFIYVTWLIHIHDMTQSYCAITHSHTWHQSFIYVTWLIHIRDMTQSYMCHDSFTYVTWLIHICDMRHYAKTRLFIQASPSNCSRVSSEYTAHFYTRTHRWRWHVTLLDMRPVIRRDGVTRDSFRLLLYACIHLIAVCGVPTRATASYMSRSLFYAERWRNATWHIPQKMLRPDIYQPEKLEFLNTNSNETRISIWICSAKYWETWVFRCGESRGYCMFSGNCRTRCICCSHACIHLKILSEAANVH